MIKLCFEEYAKKVKMPLNLLRLEITLNKGALKYATIYFVTGFQVDKWSCFPIAYFWATFRT